MLSTAFNLGALTLAAVMLVDGNTLGIMGILITSVAGLVAQYLRSRADDRKAQRQHDWDVQDQAAASTARAALMRELSANTELTKQLGAKAEQAYNEANHVNEKIAKIAAAAKLAQDDSQ